MSKDYNSIAARAMTNLAPEIDKRGITQDELAYYLKLDDDRHVVDLSNLDGINKAARNIIDNLDFYRQVKVGMSNVAEYGGLVLKVMFPMLIVLSTIVVVLYMMYLTFGPGWLSLGAINVGTTIITVGWGVYVVMNNKMRFIDPSKLGSVSLDIGGLKI